MKIKTNKQTNKIIYRWLNQSNLLTYPQVCLKTQFEPAVLSKYITHLFFKEKNKTNSGGWMVKFIHSEKATKFCEIFT